MFVTVHWGVSSQSCPCSYALTHSAYQTVGLIKVNQTSLARIPEFRTSSFQGFWFLGDRIYLREEGQKYIVFADSFFFLRECSKTINDSSLPDVILKPLDTQAERTFEIITTEPAFSSFSLSVPLCIFNHQEHVPFFLQTHIRSTTPS